MDVVCYLLATKGRLHLILVIQRVCAMQDKVKTEHTNYDLFET
jgi:hypothetical protein